MISVLSMTYAFHRGKFFVVKKIFVLRRLNADGIGHLSDCLLYMVQVNCGFFHSLTSIYLNKSYQSFEILHYFRRTDHFTAFRVRY